MQSSTRQSFLAKAEDRLAGVRGSLLLFAQGRLSAADLIHASRRLDKLGADAEQNGLADTAGLAADCSGAIKLVAATDHNDAQVTQALDLISRLEAEILQIQLSSGDFLSDVGELVEASFEHFKGISAVSDSVAAQEPADEDFEVDDETFEIFRSEAEGLLANISANLNTLSRTPEDNNALWEIRRNAHTFKGAAGIIGLREASALAHRIEDLLDKMVESGRGADARVIDLLSASTEMLDDMTAGKHVNDDGEVAAKLYSDFANLLASAPSSGVEPVAAAPAKNRVEAVVSTPAPIVRVSLDRLDDLLDVSRSLLANRSALALRVAELMNDAGPMSDLDELLDAQHRLSDEMLRMLQQIRMVRFGTLEMRLNRAVHVTCQEENKKAFAVLENPDLEIDTQVIDALIEPLLHLLKNAVVHGIERGETRRLLGKPEQGRICIAVTTDENDVCLSVEDDGRGISGSKLIEKAIANGIIDSRQAAEMDEAAVTNLIFNRGLTTADSLNLNAGRGVGMSIVKESVESRGGRVDVESEQQQGTKFTIRMPRTLTQPVIERLESEPVDESTADMPPLILIVDDSPSIRRMTAKIVEDAGFRSITAEHGAEAIELLLSGNWEPDLILTDVEMPLMDGWEFLEYVKTDDNFGHIPVMMVTSLSSDECRQKATDLGASDYLVKPFSLAELDRVLDTLGILAAT